jgi:hypothetical protein
MSPERLKEFSELSAFVNFVMTNVHGVSSENSAKALDDVVQKFGMSKALTGLKQATNDTIEELSRRPAEYIEILDAALQAAGILTVSEVRRRYAGSFQRILKRGSIKNETEYYLVNGIVVDLTSSVSNEERAQLQAMLDAYEHIS